MREIVYLILSFFFVSHAMAMEIEDSDWNDLSLSDSCSATIELYCANDTSLIRILDTISKAKENVREYVISYEKNMAMFICWYTKLRTIMISWTGFMVLIIS